MKPSQNKSGTSSQKSKKTFRERDKRKSQIPTEVNPTTERSPTTKESATRLYAGIDADILVNYVEQSTVEHLPEEITNLLTEDVNYRLRYIVNDSLIKARLCGRNAISSTDVEYCFENLKVEKPYGAPTDPHWVQFCDQPLYCLDESTTNLIEIAESVDVFYQPCETSIVAKWIPEQNEISKPLKTYFNTMCHMIVHNDINVRRMALNNISENCRIGPIVEWFYNFGYILLSKDITFDNLTLRALDLITVLEISPGTRINVSEKQLKLLVRLILQRLLQSAVASEVLRPMCNTLALLCLREPLKQFVIAKILQKIDQVFDKCGQAIITTATCLGIEAIQTIICPYLPFILGKIEEEQNYNLSFSLLEACAAIYRENLFNSSLYDAIFECMGESALIFSKPSLTNVKILNQEINLVCVKRDLFKTMRKIPLLERKECRISIEEVFEVPLEVPPVETVKQIHINYGVNLAIKPRMNSYVSPFNLRYKMRNNWDRQITNGKYVLIGKTSLLLPVLRNRRKIKKLCYDHTLMMYNL